MCFKVKIVPFRNFFFFLSRIVFKYFLTRFYNFQKTLIIKVFFLVAGDCIPNKQAKLRRTPSEPPKIHAHVESPIDVASLDQPDDGSLQLKIRDLEEQTKLIPLLQLQIQALREERINLQSQLESRASSTSSSSPHPHPVFQAHRVSPVSLNAMKIAPNVMPKRSTGTNTNAVLRRDVGCSPDTPMKMIQRGTSTEFVLKTEGDGGRLYTERDLKKAIEMAHAKMRKTSVTIGTQFGGIEIPKWEKRANSKLKDLTFCVNFRPKMCSVAIGTSAPLMRNAACGTEEQSLMMTTIKGITISPSTVPNQQLVEAPVSSLSLKDMSKLPIVRTSATQTLNPSMHQQATQYSPLVTSKATDSNDLIRVVHKLSMTEVSAKRDQTSHTGDLVKVQQTGTNTPPPLVAITRSTASNTNSIATKTVGTNCEQQTENLNLSLNQIGNSSKIPRPSPMAQRKFVRQETFTVSTNEPEVKECPAEKLLK